jgi:hypothetical protein
VRVRTRLYWQHERTETSTDSLVRRRGFVQLVDTNPADVLLPPRCLPIYLLNGRALGIPASGLAAMTRRLTMADSAGKVKKGTMSLKTRLTKLEKAAGESSPLSDFTDEELQVGIIILQEIIAAQQGRADDEVAEMRR